MKINKGIIAKPVKTCIYGVEGIGKSTFASKFPKPLFLDLDAGTARLDVDRVDGIQSWSELISTLKEFKEMKDNPYGTLVIDTADAAARLCEKYIIKTRAGGRKSIEDIPYGKGYKMLAEKFAELLSMLDELIGQGFNVVFLAHAIMKRITKPNDDGEYDHWELKLPGNASNKIGPLVKEWADLLLFADYKIAIVGDGLKKKAKGGQRVMYTTHTPFADAKNRFNLNDELPFEYKQIAAIIPERITKNKKATVSELKRYADELNEMNINPEHFTKIVLNKTKEELTSHDITYTLENIERAMQKFYEAANKEGTYT